VRGRRAMQSMNHGLPGSNADKRQAVSLLLAAAQWNRGSAGAMVRHGQVSHVLVRTMRQSASYNGYKMRPLQLRGGAAFDQMQPRTSGPKETAADPDAKPDVQAAPGCQRKAWRSWAALELGSVWTLPGLHLALPESATWRCGTVARSGASDGERRPSGSG
jgi:hypothetical protein